MKLVEILARELKEWPNDWPAVGQAKDGSLHREPFLGGHTEFKLTRAKDYVRAIVTRAQWQEARDALSKPAKPGVPMPPISEAPKDATHWDPGLKCTPSWAKLEDGKWFWWPVSGAAIEIGWKPYVSPDCGTFIKIERQWSGEGLPPAGTVCELRSVAASWAQATIAFASRNVVVWDWVGEPAINGLCTAYAHAVEMRPIRTPEQIAAEERLAAIQEMVDDSGFDGETDNVWPSMEALYNAGYRKVKDGNQKA